MADPELRGPSLDLGGAAHGQALRAAAECADFRAARAVLLRAAELVQSERRKLDDDLQSAERAVAQLPEPPELPAAPNEAPGLRWWLPAATAGLAVAVADLLAGAAAAWSFGHGVLAATLAIAAAAPQPANRHLVAERLALAVPAAAAALVGAAVALSPSGSFGARILAAAIGAAVEWTAVGIPVALAHRLAAVGREVDLRLAQRRAAEAELARAVALKARFESDLAERWLADARAVAALYQPTGGTND